MSNKKNIGIVDYGMGNLKSVEISLNYLGYKNEFVKNPNVLNKYSHLILPGVGSFKKAIKNLKSSGMDKALVKIIKIKKQKILGICLGMQLLFTSSAEDGFTKGLGIVEGKVEKFSLRETKNQKILHVGFNEVYFNQKNFFCKNIKNKSDFYFDHSYRIVSSKKNINPMISNYGSDFLSGFNYQNIYGSQFHPEKSQSNGLLLLRNFIQQ